MTPEIEITPTADGPQRPLSRISLAALAFSATMALLAMSAGIGHRLGLWHFSTGFDMLRWAAYGAIIAIGLAAFALARTRPGGSRRGFPFAVLALVLALVVVAIPWQQRRIAQSVPPIHDITTDTDDPPEFVAVAPLRANAPNPVEYAGEQSAQLQRSAYPEIRPLVLALPARQAFERALTAARGQGWTIVEADPGEGRIEATDRTFWFGFYDDVVIRLTPMNGRTVVDVRSKSRVGRSDVGANARRIQRYLRDVAS
jgi:uncharacterized protein (DUF1499 family)